MMETVYYRCGDSIRGRRGVWKSPDWTEPWAMKGDRDNRRESGEAKKSGQQERSHGPGEWEVKKVA